MLPQTCLAMVQTAERHLEKRDLPLADIDDDLAILRVEVCGICGSDYEQFEDELGMPTPVVPGHKPLGIIEKIGDRAARRWKVNVGDRVAVGTMISCHCCNTCLSGSHHLCGDRRINSYIPLGEAPGLWGAYAEYMYLHPNAIVHKITKSPLPEVAVMFNPLGAGFRWAVEIPRTKPSGTVVIMGTGQRGLSSVIAAQRAGGRE